MKLLGRKRVRTCLSMLLVVTCLLTSFLFVNIDSKAQDQVVDSFYILDEEGNPVTVEITQEDLMSDIQSPKIRMFSFARSGVETRDNVVGVVRFKSVEREVNGEKQVDPLVDYTEVDSERGGYFHCKSAGDAAYLGTDADGNIICKLSGVIMRVPAEHKKEIVSFSDCGDKEISYYSIIDGYLVHTYTWYNGNELSTASTRVGYKPGYMQNGVKYYSYDGHYFYTDFAKMISDYQDYQNGTHSNAVNANTPYYNYYQYLSMHTKAPFTPAQYNSYIAANKKDSVMLTTGNAFASAQNTYTINALLMFGVAINESAWGTSSIAKTKNNLFGLNAVDSSPGESANKFKSVESCIAEFAYEWMHKDYLNGGDSRYRGPHLGDKHSGINVKYASDPYWGEKAAARGYYFDTNKADYGRYTIGIATSGKINCYKEADTASKVIYTTDASNGSKIYDFPVMIVGEVTGSNGELFYKVISDMSLKDDRSARNVNEKFNTARDYVYVQAKDVKKVFDGSGNIDIPNIEIEQTGKTHEEVLTTLNVANKNNYLTGFAVGSDVATSIAKVKALDSNLQIVVKKADGTQLTNGMVATGMQMTITTNGGTVNYTVVIKGDVNGDGKLSAIDYVKLRNYLDGVSTLSGAYLEGTDTSGDGKTSALDYVKLRNHLDNKSAIAQ